MNRVARFWVSIASVFAFSGMVHGACEVEPQDVRWASGSASGRLSFIIKCPSSVSPIKGTIPTVSIDWMNGSSSDNIPVTTVRELVASGFNKYAVTVTQRFDKSSVNGQFSNFQATVKNLPDFLVKETTRDIHLVFMCGYSAPAKLCADSASVEKGFGGPDLFCANHCVVGLKR